MGVLTVHRVSKSCWLVSPYFFSVVPKMYAGREIMVVSATTFAPLARRELHGSLLDLSFYYLFINFYIYL